MPISPLLSRASIGGAVQASLLLATAACSNTRVNDADAAHLIAEQYCQPRFDCGCTDSLEDLDECTNGQEQLARDALSELEGLGFRVTNATCAAELHPDCGPLRDGTTPSVATCPPFVCELGHGPRKDGESCTNVKLSPSLVDDDCQEGLRCDPVLQVCVDRCFGYPLAPPVGAACDPNAGPFPPPCDLDAYCDVDTETCVAFPDNGQPCAPVGCNPFESFCDPTTGYCVASRADGDACELSVECLSGTCSDDGRCADSTPAVCF